MGAPKHRPVRRSLLEKIARPVLAGLLSPFADALAKRGVDVAALAEEPPIERRRLERLYELLATYDPELADVHARLLAIDDAASPTAVEALVAADTERVLDPSAAIGVETWVATAWLDHRELFNRVRPQVVSTASKAQAHYAPKAFAPMADDRALDARLHEALRVALVARARSDYLKSYWTRHGSERHLEIVFGKLATTRDVIAKQGDSHDLAAQVTDRSTERAFAVVHEDTGVLTLTGHEWLKELLRRPAREGVFGQKGDRERARESAKGIWDR